MLTTPTITDEIIKDIDSNPNGTGSMVLIRYEYVSMMLDVHMYFVKIKYKVSFSSLSKLYSHLAILKNKNMILLG